MSLKYKHFEINISLLTRHSLLMFPSVNTLLILSFLGLGRWMGECTLFSSYFESSDLMNLTNVSSSLRF